MSRIVSFAAVAIDLAALNPSVSAGFAAVVVLVLVVAILAFAVMSVLARLLTGAAVMAGTLLAVLGRVAVVGLLALIVAGALLLLVTFGRADPPADAVQTPLPTSGAVMPPR